mmetsp:Transcript_33620/g.56483  ORF Transcript_33620/g.56483 Transcript_33620/m.56483 type:complete len:413 (-) Transcript_33620:228-1466(-)|eukprot:CAMPEP_0198199482 /NCGR_PEP_ID=MMETSP1445-20131203/2774_1 /TAXON_ID=36898 /ORGANISM="Pyramimonas sp., Strain CCMP2087" /LENGTH=412 /DNA_ID=CAMNT_0043869341 /DNA_START=46 /DNA_END=1284 /DNA_ORIENTATION=+
MLCNLPVRSICVTTLSVRCASTRVGTLHKWPVARKHPSVLTHAKRNSNNELQTPTPDTESYYDILQVEPEKVEDLAALRANYRRLQKMYHPDVFKDEGAKSQLLNTAYATLLDPVKRMEYDRGIGARGNVQKTVLRTAEGLVGPMAEGDLLTEEGFSCRPDSGADALCNLAGQDFEEAVTYLRQWAQTLAYVGEIPLPMPLQCDSVEDGVRIAIISTERNRIVSLGELTFVVVSAMDDDSEYPTQSVQVRRRLQKSSKAKEVPGERRIMKSFNKAMKSLRGEGKNKGWKLSGVFAAIASGAIGLIPWGSDESSPYDSYYLRPQGKRRTSGMSYILREEWAVLKSSTMEYMRFGGANAKLRRCMSDDAINEFEQQASDTISEGDEATSDAQLKRSMDALQERLQSLRKAVPDL